MAERRQAATDENDTINVDEALEQIAAILKLEPCALDSDPSGAELSRVVRDMAANGHRQEDPIRATFVCLGSKYSKLLLSILRAGTFRHSTLRRLASVMAAEKDVSQRMLTLRLRDLERDGFIRRKIIPTVPPTVEYSLTPFGREFADQVDALIRWISAHSTRIKKSRLAFDLKNAPGRWHHWHH